MKIVKILPIFGVIVLIILIILVPVRLLKVRKVICISQFGNCEDFLTSKLNQANNLSIYDSEKRINKILESDVLVENYTIQYNIPTTLRVNVILRKPAYSLKNTSGEFALIDPEGYVVSLASNSNLLAVQIGDNLPKAGEQLDPRLNFALQISKDMNYLYPGVSAIITNDTLQTKLPIGPTVIFPLEGDKELLVGSARFIISKLIEGNENLRIDNVAQVDLRFKNPVLR